MSYNIFIAVVVLLATAWPQSDTLPRRAFFGVALEKTADGVRVSGVSPDSTAAASGIVIGDLIQAVDGRTTDTTEAVIAAVLQHKAGDPVRISFLRAGTGRTIEATLKSLPFEQMANSTVTYGSVASSPSVNLRTIVSVPNGQAGVRYPAVLLLQGGGCGSIDSPFNVTLAQPGLVHAVGSKGFVTMRVEKSGVGDSGGPPCDSIGFREELAGYRAAFDALRAHPSVDSRKIYLIGISLGGVFAPLLAAETNVAGIIVYGTPAMPPPPYPGRSERFFKEFAAVDVSGAWSRVASRVLVLHGEYDVDPVISREVHESIARMVSAGKGSAEFHELAGLDHCWTRHASLEASKDKCGQGEETPVFVNAVLDFLRKG